MKVVLVVIDSFGIGAMPDADKFGDTGSNTYLNVYNNTNIDLINLKKLGLDNIDGIGEVRRNELLKKYKTITKLKSLNIEQLDELLPHQVSLNLKKFLDDLK